MVQISQASQGWVVICDEPMMAPESASLIVKTGDGRTGDSHEFHLSETLLQATLDLSGSILAIWASEPALPHGSYEPSVGVESRYFRLEMSRAQAEGLRDRLSAALGRRRRKKLAQS